jgi:hypothetical protein
MHIPHRKPIPNGGERSYGGQAQFGVWTKALNRFQIRIHHKTYAVHRLIAEAFHGPPPFDGAVAMHLDENAANNRASNIRWGTQKENLNAEGFIAYCKTRIGDDNPLVKGCRAREAETNDLK